MMIISCNTDRSQNSNRNMIEQTSIFNEKIRKYAFLECMYDDPYFPKFLVDKCKVILLELCFEIESKKPSNLEELYKLTHSSTERLNELQDEFFENDSEIETGAREYLAIDFEFVAKSHGYDADIEELITTREW